MVTDLLSELFGSLGEIGPSEHDTFHQVRELVLIAKLEFLRFFVSIARFCKIYDTPAFNYFEKNIILARIIY